MYLSILIFSFLFCHLNADNGGWPNILPRILYGDKVKIEDYPYFAGLANCGAVIISDRWLLTAAHCFPNSENRHYYKFAYVGGETVKNSQKVHYDSVIIHEDFKNVNGIPINDIAVIKLKKPLKFSSKIQPIKLPEPNMAMNDYLEFIGRGMGEHGHLTTDLLKMDVERLSTQDCISLIPPEYHNYIVKFKKILGKSNICAKRTIDKPGMCNGDSGSPLVDDDVVVGLASFGGSSCHHNRLGFYVNVPYYVNWIKQVTGLK